MASFSSVSHISIKSHRKFSILLFSLDTPVCIQTHIPLVSNSLRIRTCRCAFQYEQIFGNNLTTTRRNPIHQNSQFSTKLQHKTNYYVLGKGSRRKVSPPFTFHRSHEQEMRAKTQYVLKDKILSPVVPYHYSPYRKFHLSEKYKSINILAWTNNGGSFSITDR